MQQLLTGKTKFAGFSDEWQTVMLGDISIYRNGGSFENEIVENGKYYLITLNSLDIHGNLKKEHKTINTCCDFLDKDDLIMILSDIAHGNFLGLTNIIPRNSKYILNQRVGAITPDKNINSYFLSKYINFQ